MLANFPANYDITAGHQHLSLPHSPPYCLLVMPQLPTAAAVQLITIS